MISKNILLTGLLLLSSVITTAQTKITAGVMQGKDYGVTYTLPKSNIEITLITSKKEYQPGEFAKYANTYLHLNNIPVEAQTYWTLDKIKISSIGVPDPDKTFFVRMKDKTVAPLMELTQDGLIKSINIPFSKEQGADQKKELEPKKDINPKDYFTEDILLANSSAKMAELVAKEIYSIRESKNSLLRGEAENTPQDGKQLKLMLDNLEEQEEALTSLFKGKVTTTIQEFKVSFEPDQEINNQVISRFSKHLGIVDSDDLSGEPIYISLHDLKSVNIPEDDGKRKVSGIAYNIPGKAHITVKFKNTIISEGDLPITQFGGVEYLAPALFNKKSKIQALFDSNTGSLLKVDREDI